MIARVHKSLFLAGFLCLSISVCLNAQPGDKPGNELQNLEREYNEFLQNALKLQIRTDSLLRISNEKREQMRSIGDETEKSRLSREIMALEQQAMDMQAETNKKYATARNLEMRLLAMRRSSQDPPPPAAQSQGQIRPLDPKREDILLLTFFYGKPEMEPFVGLSALTKLRSVEKQAFQVNRMFNEVAEINQEVENLKVSINNDLRGRKKRNARKRVEELEKKSFNKNLEALTFAETVNSVKLEVLVNVVNAARINATVREQIQMASVHENAASENIREANESRRVAAEALSEKFVFDYLLRAYQKEAIAVEELLKAFDLLTGRTALPPRIPEIVRSPERTASDPDVTKSPSGTKPPPPAMFPSAKPRYPDPSIPVNTALPAGQSYKIQIGIWQNDVTPPDFSGLPAMTAEVEEGSSSVRYYSGLYKRFTEAERALLDARRLGFRDAFIVAYQDSRRIPINRAVSMETQNMERVATPPAEIQAPPPPAARTEQTASEVVFKVQVGVFRELVAPETRNRFMSIAGNQKVEFTRNDSGLFVYTIGNFTTFEEAVQAREQIVSAGIVDAFVVAFRNGEKIPLNQVIK
jgi:hypothetical protein